MKPRNLIPYALSAVACLTVAWLLWNRASEMTVATEGSSPDVFTNERNTEARLDERFESALHSEALTEKEGLPSTVEEFSSGKESPSAPTSSPNVKSAPGAKVSALTQPNPPDQTADRRLAAGEPRTRNINAIIPSRGDETAPLGPGEVEIAVPSGAQLPIAFGLLEADGESSQGEELPQQRLANMLAADFAEEIAASDTEHKTGRDAATPQHPDPLARWQSAAAKADERFRVLFGYEIYNREIIRQHQLKQ